MSGILMSAIGTARSSGITVTEIAATSIKTAGTNNLTSGSISMSAGRVYVVLVAWDPSGDNVPTVSLSDTENTYTSLGSQYPAPATTSSGTGVISQAFVTTAATSQTSRTITATFSASITAKCMIVFEASNCTTTERNAETVSRGTTGDPSYTSPSANVGDLMFSMAAQETNTANIPTAGPANTVGTWSTQVTASTTGTNPNTNIMLAYEYAIVTTAGTQTIAWTLPSTDNWGSQTFVLASA